MPSCDAGRYSGRWREPPAAPRFPRHWTATIFCRSPLLVIAEALAKMVSTPAGICARMRIDQRVVHDAVLVARLPGDDMSEAGFPDFAVQRRRAQGLFGKAGLAQQLELFAADFLAAQLGRINGVGVDHQRRDPARPSIAAAVEPASPPPMMATSVYRMPLGLSFPARYFCAVKDKESLKETSESGCPGSGLTEKQCRENTIPLAGRPFEAPTLKLSVTINSPNLDLGPQWDDLVARASSNVFMNPAALTAACETSFARIRILLAWEQERGIAKAGRRLGVAVAESCAVLAGGAGSAAL